MKIPYKDHFVNLLHQDHKSEEYTRLNPNKAVPSLIVTNGKEKVVLTQSLAIIEWIDQVYSNGGIELIPKDPFVKAKVKIVF